MLFTQITVAPDDEKIQTFGCKDGIKGENSKSKVKQQKKWERGMDTISSWHLDNGWVKKIRRHLMSLTGITK